MAASSTAMYDRVVGTISKHPTQRSQHELEALIPWFEKKHALFSSITREAILDILKNCEFSTRPRDNIIIKQGEKGDCFFIIIRGSVSIYINSAIADEEDEAKIAEQARSQDLYSPEGELDRTKLGNYIATIGTGKSFGELALINKNCIRNASILADETTDLALVNRELYNRSLKAAQVAEIEERNRFVKEHPLFSSWHAKHKKQLAYSINKVKVEYDGHVVKQGENVDGLYFFLSGQAKLVVEPSLHTSQFPQYFAMEPGLTSPRAQTDIDPGFSQLDILSGRDPDHGHPVSKAPSAMRRRQHRRRLVEVCIIGRNEIIGDAELSLSLKTYASSVVSTQESYLYSLSLRNFERLVQKRNPRTLDVMRANALVKLQARLCRMYGEPIPLFRTLVSKLQEAEARPSTSKTSSAKRSDQGSGFMTSLHSSVDFLPQRGALIDMYGPGTVYYRNKMRELAKEKIRSRSNFRGAQGGFGLKLGTMVSSTNELLAAAEANRPPIRLLCEPQDDPNTSIPTFLTKAEEDEEEEEEEEDSDDVAQGSFKDFKSSDKALTVLEERIKAWHATVDGEVVVGGRTGRAHQPQATIKLKRVHLDKDKDLIPGTKVNFHKRKIPIPEMPLGSDGVSTDSSTTGSQRTSDRDNQVIMNEASLQKALKTKENQKNGFRMASPQPDSSTAQLHSTRVRRTEEEASVDAEDHGESEDVLARNRAVLPSLMSSDVTSSSTSSSSSSGREPPKERPILETQGTILDLIESTQRAMLQKRKSQEQLHFLLSQTPAQKLLKRSNTIADDYFPKIGSHREAFKKPITRIETGLGSHYRKHPHKDNDVILGLPMNDKSPRALISILKTKLPQCTEAALDDS